MSTSARRATLPKLPAQSLGTLRFTLILIAWLTFQSLSFRQPTAQGPEHSAELLSIRLSTPPHWEKGCLSLRLERKNIASFPLYIPLQGLDIYMSASQVPDLAEGKEQESWVPVYGISDLLVLEANPLGPGATIGDEICLSPTVGVASREKRSHRLIPLRGRLRIDASYYMSQENWRSNMATFAQKLHTPADQWDKIPSHPPETTTTLAAIPCHEIGCSTACQSPPPVVRDENLLIPDVVQDNPAWIASGKALGLELAAKSPTCSEDITAPR